MYPDYSLSIIESAKELFVSKGKSVIIPDDIYEKYGLNPNYENNVLELKGDSIILLADIDYEFDSAFDDSSYTTVNADGAERSWKYDYNTFFPAYCMPRIIMYSSEHDSLVELTRDLCCFFESEKKSLVKHPILPNAYISLSLHITNDNNDTQISSITDLIYKSVVNFDLIEIPWSTGKIDAADLDSDVARRCWLKKMISTYEVGNSMELKINSLRLQPEQYASEIDSLTEKRKMLRKYYADLINVSHVDSKLADITRFKEILRYMEVDGLSYLEATKKILDDIENEVKRKKQEREEKRARREKERELLALNSAESSSQQNERQSNRSKYWVVEQMVQKTSDFACLMKTNYEFAQQLSNRITLPDDAVIVTDENAEEILTEIRSKGISKTYIIITADFSYNLGHRKYVRYNKAGEALVLYYNEESLPSVYSPRLDIVSTEYSKAYDVFSKMLDACSNGFTLKTTLDEAENYLLINTRLDESEVPSQLSDGDDKIHAVIKMTKTPFYLCFEEYSQIKYGSMSRYRELQRALFYASIIEQIPLNIKRELLNYTDLLTVKKGLVNNFLASLMPEPFKQLKFNVLCNQPYTTDMVDRAFPWLSLFYRGLPNDLMKWSPVEAPQAAVNQILSDYKKQRADICKRYSVPRKINVKDIEITDDPADMGEKKAVEFILKELIEDFDKPMAEIVDHYESLAYIGVCMERGRREAELAAREERRLQEMEDDYYEPREERSSSFLGDVAAAAIGGTIANHGVKKELRRQNEILERQRKEDDKRRRDEEDRRRREAESERRRREREESKRRQEEAKRESQRRWEEQQRRWKEEQEKLDRARRRK